MPLRSPPFRSALCVLLGSTLCFAENARSGDFSVQKFEPAPGPRNLITVEGARTDGKMAFSLGMFVNYANDPFVIRSCRTFTDCGSPNAQEPRDVHVVQHIGTADFLASLTPVPRLQLGLRLPLTIVNGEGLETDLASSNAGRPLKGGLKGFGIGDPMLEAKVRALGNVNDPFVLGAALFVTGPLGTATAKDKYVGESSPTVGLRGIFDGQLGIVSLAGNISGTLAKQETIASTALGSSFNYGAGVGVKVSPILRVIAEGYGATRFSSQNGTNSMELLGAAQVTPLNSRITLTAGLAAGVVEGIGVPKYRALLGILWNNERVDSDGDGIPDDRDQCPTVAEDLDGFQDQDGCPEPDNDGDNIPDVKDKCPNEPEVVNGIKDDDGCPDDISDRDKDGIPDEEDKCPDDGGPNVIHRKGASYGCVDRDKDGVADNIDKCPDEPEDTDGFEDEDGCPDPDNDQDKILDSDDQCVDQPEIYNGFQDDDGCPDEVPDSDKDGIPDNKDKCPQAPENYNGFQDDDGCPDQGPPTLVEVSADAIKIKDVINFDKDSDKIIGKTSFLVLDGVASAMAHHPEIFKVEVGGHTDNAGDRAHNVDLSKRRAASVVDYLMSKGVAKTRLSSQGFGPDKPIADNAKAAGKSKNRRVEFSIVSSLKKSGVNK